MHQLLRWAWFWSVIILLSFINVQKGKENSNYCNQYISINNYINHFFAIFYFELTFSILSFFSFLSKIKVFFSSSSTKVLLTKLLGKKYLSYVWDAKSALNSSLIFFLSELETFKFSYPNLKVFVLIGEVPRSQGWLIISLTPFKDPILWRGFFTNNPFINPLASLDIKGDLGNLG